MWRFFPSMLTVFTNFSGFFLAFPYYKKTSDARIYQIMSSFFYFQATLNRLPNNCVRLHWYQINSYCNMKERGVKVLPNWPPLPLSSTKTTLEKPSLGLGFYYCRLPNPKITAQSIEFRQDMSRKNVRHDANLPMIGCSDARCWFHQHILVASVHSL